MKTIKISEATTTQIDYLVAKEEGYENLRRNPHRFAQHLIMNLGGTIKALGELNYSTDYAQGVHILERERIGVWPSESVSGAWAARPNAVLFPRGVPSYGPTMLIAGLRCFLASKLGETVEIPEELV